MSDKPQHEHRVVKAYNDGTRLEGDPSKDPAVVGKTYKAWGNTLFPGESVEIETREVTSWKPSGERREAPK